MAWGLLCVPGALGMGGADVASGKLAERHSDGRRPLWDQEFPSLVQSLFSLHTRSGGAGGGSCWLLGLEKQVLPLGLLPVQAQGDSV